MRKSTKFGIDLPKSISDAYKIDEDTGTTFWYDTVKKEMRNVRIAFNILDHGKEVPVGYQYMRCHFVFDIKMDLTRKARLVAGGHMTSPPASSTYASVVLRESVRIAFTVAALNDRVIEADDIQNAYLVAPCNERI